MRVCCYLLMGMFLCALPIRSAETNGIDSAKLAFNVKTLGDAYDKVGRRNPAWDEDARRSLTLFAQRRATTNGLSVELEKELTTRLSGAMARKCDDPMIRYLYVRDVFTKTSSAQKSAAAFREMAAALEKSGYPDIRKFYALYWTWHWMREAGSFESEIPAVLTKTTTYLAKALESKELPAFEGDAACDLLLTAVWEDVDDAVWRCYEKLEPALTQHWKNSSWALLIKGRAYLSHAWQARGRGAASTVSAEAGREFDARLGTAAAALEAAWALNPRDSRICLAMLRVDMGHSRGRKHFEMWFQRGMKVAPGNWDLCSAKLEYLRPRWYGSVKEMVDFGRECTMNTNWSGGVRLLLAEAHVKVSQEIVDESKRTAYLDHPRVWADIKFAYEQFFKLYPKEVSYRHSYARYASWCGQWQEVLNQVKLFPYTNYAYFGGLADFNSMVQNAAGQLKK